VASYLRLLPGRWSAPFQSWGRENRESGLRLITGSRAAAGDAANIEAKVFDNSANPYLLVGAVLAAGLAGLATGAGLPAEATVDPGSLSDADRADLGIRRLPASLADSLACFEASPVLPEAFGDDLARSFVSARRGEVDLFADAAPEEVILATRWRH
jgi:glutamine synthetase